MSEKLLVTRKFTVKFRFVIKLHVSVELVLRGVQIDSDEQKTSGWKPFKKIVKLYGQDFFHQSVFLAFHF